MDDKGLINNDQLAWKLAANWLADANILPRDNKVFQADAQVFDLVQVLRDGILLCYLARSLDPQAIPDYGTISTTHASQVTLILSDLSLSQSTLVFLHLF